MREKHDQIVDVAKTLAYANPAKEKGEAIKVRPSRRAMATNDEEHRQQWMFDDLRICERSVFAV